VDDVLIASPLHSRPSAAFNKNKSQYMKKKKKNKNKKNKNKNKEKNKKEKKTNNEKFFHTLDENDSIHQHLLFGLGAQASLSFAVWNTS
jgi:FKBP-type peptidyl-prolyl cis-trans isomerase